MIEHNLKEISNQIPKKSTLVIHIRLKHLSKVFKDYAYWTVKLLDEIRENLHPNEIIVPTFSYEYSKTKSFHIGETPSETGRFSEEIRKYFSSNKKRTIDPIFSTIETEKGSLHNDTICTEAFGNNSIWHYLNDKPHFILNINIPLPIITTQLHYLEYKHHVPYRFMKNFNGEIIDWQNEKREISYQYFVRNHEKYSTWNRKKIAQLAASKGALIQSGPIRAFDWIKLKTALNEELSLNKNYLIQ